MSDYLFDRSGPPDPELEALELGEIERISPEALIAGAAPQP